MRGSALGEAEPGGFGLIVLDAFSSDAVPVHLLTREALRLYREKLAAGGLIVFNISNRYLDLSPVLESLAKDAGLVYRVRADIEVSREEKRRGKQPTIWAVMAVRESDLGALLGIRGWHAGGPQGRASDVWADDFSNVLGHFAFPGRFAFQGKGESGLRDR